MTSLDSFLDQVDRLTRRLIRNVEYCDRALVTCCDLTAAQAYALLTLQETGEITMNELASEMRLHSTTMTRMIDNLIEKGLVERRQDPDDRRVVRVGLSQPGDSTALRLKRTKREFLETAFSGLSDIERSALLSALQRLESIAEALGEGCCAS